MIALDMFLQGFFMLSFDLTPDISSVEPHMSLPRQATVGTDAHLKSSLTEPVIWILYAEYLGITGIGNSRNITAG
jgi:hypothetical protein